MIQATDRLQLYIDAEAAILQGQEMRMGTRLMRRADLSFVQSEIEKLQRQVNAEQRNARGGSSIRYQTPNFN